MACKTVVPETKLSGKNIPFQELITNTHSNFTEQKNITIESSEELQEIFATINATRKPGISFPKIDFEKEALAFINIGETSTGGHSVAVTEIIETEAKLVIYYEGKSPKVGENATMVITTPFTMVKFMKVSKPIVFEWVLNRN
jgi:argonaute-like protein implicated in RNA metabolism and viral defense